MRPRLSLPEALARLPGNVDAADVAAVGETSSADVFRVTVGGRLAVLRIVDRGSDMAAQLAAQRQAAAAGIAPAVLLAAPDAGLLLTDYAPGTVLTATAMEDTDSVAAVGRLLRRLHDLPRLGVTLDLEAAARRYLGQCTAPARSSAVKAEREVRALLADVDDRPGVPCHNDPVAQNFVLGESLTLLDWEYAADNDPLFDLAVVSAHHDLASRRRDALLRSYCSASFEENRRRLPTWEAIYRRIYELWSVARGKP
ncbi:MAG: phosphotransferase [Pseudomonadota bacterium]